MLNEVWAPVKNYEGHYSVSTNGRVKSNARFFNNRWKNIYIHEKILRPRPSGGYLSVALYQKGKQMTYKIHRLVAQAFIPNPKNKPEVNHINGNRQDNNLENLEWVTRQENINHAKLSQKLSWQVQKIR